MNKKIFLAVTVTALAALLFVWGCRLEINDPVRVIPIVKPYISEQPKSASYNSENFSAYFGHDELRVVVQGWNRLDGTISYQWYTFESIEDYCEHGGGTKIPGANGSVYLPLIGDDSPGNIYYYYVVVTNDYPDATEETIASIQSDIAIISFYGNGDAPYPVITRHPVNASYTIGRTASVTPLEVWAVGDGIRTYLVPDPVGAGTITYQWYSNTTFSITGGTLIDKAEGSSFMPDVKTLAKGANYFFVVVTNTFTLDDGITQLSAKATTLPVSVTMLPGEKAAAPRITEQPQSQLVFTPGGVVANLKVHAESVDGGSITYQWYKANKPADDGTVVRDNTGIRVETDPVRGEPVGGPTDKGDGFEPNVTSGTHYYYAEAINENLDVLGATTAITRSDIVTIRFAASGTKPATAFITIPKDYKTPASESRQQYIRGYGGMDVAWANFPNTTKEETELQYNPDWGLGYNILRIMIVPPGSAQGNYTNHEDIYLGRDTSRDDYNGWSGLTTKQRPDYINNVKVVNKYNGYVLASPWTPPKEWKTNNSINSGGHLMPSEYQSFANYLRSFCQFMYYQGAPIYAISIANEPNYAGGYDGCEWEKEECVDFFKKVGQFTQGARGMGGGKSTPRVLIVNGESANHPDYNDKVLADPTSRAAVDFYARHVYGKQNATLWKSCSYAEWKEGSPYQTECWMTEHNINSSNAQSFPNDYTWNYIWRFMNDIDLVIRLNNENAFVWWASKRFYSMIGDGQYECTQSQALPRGYGLSHYAKYTKDFTRVNVDRSITGFVTDSNGASEEIRVGGTGGNVNMVPLVPDGFSLDALDAKITAFVSPDGNEISMIIFTPTMPNGSSGWNLGWVEITMPDDGFEIGSVQAHKSTGDAANQLMRPYTDFTVSSSRKTAYVEVLRSEILSVKFTRK